MKNFDYMVAENVGAAVAELNAANGDQPKSSVFAPDAAKTLLKAGGIDTLDLLKERLAQPDVIVSINGIAALKGIKEADGGLHIGALTTLAELGRNPLIRERYTLLADAAGHAATPQVRERATLGGNLCQRPRCWYFRNQEFDCLKKGGDTCFAVAGENKYHAIFGNGPCHIVHPSNTAPALVALDATLTVQGPKGERTLRAREFFQMPEKNLKTENVLGANEIITAVQLPAPPTHSHALELREKQSFDWPMVMVSVARLKAGWQVCLGAVAPVPWLSEPAMKVLGNAEITPELARKAGDAAAEGAKPMSDNGYKVQLVKVAVRRALLAAAGQEVA